MAKISELEQDLNEHKIVIETLQDVSPDRKCFRMVGGVLVERTVMEVLPALLNNKEQLTKVIDSLNTKMVNKGKEVNEFRAKHNIKIRGQDEIKETQQPDPTTGTQGVLVPNKA